MMKRQILNFIAQPVLLFLLLGSGPVFGEVEVGHPAPDFQLRDQYGDCHQLADFSGKWLAVYFYPKDDTPGCTTEACNFRDNFYAFRAIGADVVGISLDDVASHKEFSDKYRLPFTILADDDGETASAYGVLRDMKVFKVARRESFLINPEGLLVKHYSKVDPDTHTQEVLADIQQLSGQSESPAPQP